MSFINSGFKGQTCNINVNECAALPCSHGSCIDGINNYTCNCTGSGYTGQTCAEDIDECETDNPCHPNATCTNYPGTYQCSCQAGFTGKNCYENVDDCRSNPCKNGGESHANQIQCCTLTDFDELLPLVLTGTHPGRFYCYQKKGKYYGQGGFPIELTGMPIGKLKLNLKFKLTSNGYFCVVRVAAFLVNFFIHSP